MATGGLKTLKISKVQILCKVVYILSFFSFLAVVVVKWPVCSPSTLTIQVQTRWSLQFLLIKCLKRNEKEAGDCQLKFLNFAGDGLLQHAVVLVTRRVDQLHNRDCRLVPSRRACRGPRKIRKNSFRASALRVHSRRTKGEADGKLNF